MATDTSRAELNALLGIAVAIFAFQSRRFSRRESRLEDRPLEKKGSLLMSADAGSLGSGSMGSTAAPPPSAPAAPPAATPTPAAAEATPVAPAVATPAAAPVSDAAAVLPGALPSETAEPPKTLDEAKAKYRQAKMAGTAGQEAQPDAVPGEAALAPVPAPIEVQPEVVEPVVEPVEAAPAEEAAPVELADDDFREAAWTQEDIQSKFARKLSKKEIAEVAQREAHRGELRETVRSIGGDVGVRIASIINPILLEVDHPTEEHVDALFDQIVLPENAGAGELFDLMGKRLINMQLQDEVTGREFGSQMISEEWGKNDDGSDFDFGGMAPIEFVDLLMKAAKFKDEEGESLLKLDFLKSELDSQAKPAKSEREQELERENAELRTKTQGETTAKEAEEARKAAEVKTQYETQSKQFVSMHIMRAVTPLAIKANWAAVEGEEGDQVEQKKELGELIADHVNMKIMGPAGAASPEYQAVLEMIENGTAFDRTTGKVTPRFLNKLEPLATKAKALFNRKMTALNPRLKFTSQTSRNAQLVEKNGVKKVGAPPAAEAPQLAAAPSTEPAHPLTTEERLAARKEKYRQLVRTGQATAGVR